MSGASTTGRHQISAPISVYLHVTNRCNMGCLHCSSSSGAAADGELNTEEWLEVVRSLARMKVFKVMVIGGELLVRPDIFEILDALASHPFVVTLFSNCTLVTEEVAARLARYSLKGVRTSLDGSTAQIHDRLRRSGSFERAVAGMRGLIDRGIPVSVTVVATQLNCDDIENIVEYAFDLGVTGVAINHLNLLGRAVTHREKLMLTRTQAMELAVRSEKLEAKYGGKVASGFLEWHKRFSSEPAKDGSAGHLLSCSAGRSACAIKPDGQVIPCGFFWDYECGSVRVQDLQEIWLHSPQLAQLRELVHHTVDEVEACEGCRFRSLCDAGCRAMSFAYHGSLLDRDPFCWLSAGEYWLDERQEIGAVVA